MKCIQILKADHDKNHPGSETWLYSLEEILSRLCDDWCVVKINKTMILYHPVGALGDGVEFHCYNADTATGLAENVLMFLEECGHAGYVWATTPYKNEKIKELFEEYIKPSNLVTYDDDDGYITTVTLEGL